MASLSITEYQHAERGPEGTLQVPLEIGTVTRTARTLSGASAQSNAFQTTTRYLRLCSDTACYYRLGTNPTAITATDTYLPAGVIDYVAVPVGQSYKIAAIT